MLRFVYLCKLIITIDYFILFFMLEISNCLKTVLSLRAAEDEARANQSAAGTPQVIFVLLCGKKHECQHEVLSLSLICAP